ncbi:LADA_0B10770g1_1 [Lachancea dasiensis]|uniref:LADA_0B10770g1_1 n=1 Tax=Lachancea dasiensis TaxID=1072105 RepID=A0A1G4IVP4_9SACH|nr:LADA_0B10770g1_1 [Lachancea dasiensis]
MLLPRSIRLLRPGGLVDGLWRPVPPSLRNHSIALKSYIGRPQLNTTVSRLSVISFHTQTRSFSATRRVQSTDTAHKNKAKDKAEKPHKEASKMGFSEVLRLFKLARHDWKLLCVAIGLLTISSSVGMAIPKVIGLVLDSVKNAYGDAKGPITLEDLPPIAGNFGMYDFLGVFAGALILGTAANFGRIVLLRVLGEKLVARLRSNVIRKIIHQDAEFFDRNKVGDLISRLSSDAYVVSRSMTQNVSDGFKAVICGGVGIGMMVSISTPLTSALLFFAPPLLIGATIYGKKIRTISRELQQSTGNLTRVSEEQLNGVKTIQSFVAEGKELKRYNNAIRKVFSFGRKEALANATFFSSTGILGDLSFLIVLGYGSHLVLQGGLTVGDLTAFMLYTEYTGSAVFGLSTFFSELMKGAGAASRLFEMTDHTSSIKSSIGKSFVPGTGKIDFHNVSFAYPTRPNNHIFKDMNFTIESGSNVCIVGPSGRGKSTITSLLLRYYDPVSGNITIDGQDISKVSSKSLRRHLGVVQQEPMLMSGSIKYNLTYGLNSEVSMEEIRSAAKKCFCHGFITKFPDGYDTIIGPRGASLSGGQRQRISIARALIKKPKILILDEATSALDVESEGAINYTLGKLMKSRELTIISIAHRLSTIRRSENVIVLGHDGSVVEMGKFKELYANENSELFKLLNDKKNDKPSKSFVKGLPEGTENSEEMHINDEVLEHMANDISLDQKASKLTP